MTDCLDPTRNENDFAGNVPTSIVRTEENEMIGKLGLPELLLLLGVALMIFGPGKIGELGKGIGDGIRGFKTAVQGGEKEPSK